jgi:hypothetical protein
VDYYVLPEPMLSVNGSFFHFQGMKIDDEGSMLLPRGYFKVLFHEYEVCTSGMTACQSTSASTSFTPRI